MLGLKTPVLELRGSKNDPVIKSNKQLCKLRRREQQPSSRENKKIEEKKAKIFIDFNFNNIAILKS